MRNQSCESIHLFNPQQKSSAFSSAEMFKKPPSMTNSVDPDQTAPIGAVCSGSTLFASILKCVKNARQFFAADEFSRRHFLMHFFSWRFKG